MNILVATNPFCLADKTPLKLLKKYGFSITKTSEENIPNNLEKFDALIAGLYNFDAKTLKKFSNLKVISRVGVGYDNIDISFLKKNNIKLAITPNLHGRAVAELILANMLAKIRDVILNNCLMKNGVWNRSISHELNDFQIGIFGYGCVGKELVSVLKGIYKKKIYIHDLYINKKKIRNSSIKFISKNLLLKKSDIIILCIPSNNNNKYFVDKKSFQIMKKNVFLINTSRGNIIDENNLVSFLRNNKSSFASLDVFENEPYIGQLKNLKNVMLSPHIASNTFSTRSKMEILAVKNVIDFFKKNKNKNFII